MSRDTASDIVKSLGGRVTSGVSGKTDYLIAGSILEDGRLVEEGSKYKKCLGMWEAWGDKWRKEYEGDGGDEDAEKRGKRKASAPKKDRDPNALVEIVRGIYEFYGLVVFLSEWKRGTLPESERREPEARRTPREGAKEPARAVGTPASSPADPSVGSAAGAGSAVANPYASAGKDAASNPYAKKSPANPYARKSPANPYAKPSGASNPYAKKSPSAGNPYASRSPSATPAQPAKAKHQPSGKELGANSLWADRYAPATSREILGNSDSVNKLNRWLSSWESTFNNPQRKSKSFSGPNGPYKAALLSGPPGIGEFAVMCGSLARVRVPAPSHSFVRAGKTTTATLVARESGRDVLELNASDARSKKALGQALGDVTGSQVLSFGNTDGSKKKTPVQRRCIIMDEVDGMGAGDRSGMSELIQMIKKSKVPIVSRFLVWLFEPPRAGLVRRACSVSLAS